MFVQMQKQKMENNQLIQKTYDGCHVGDGLHCACNDYSCFFHLVSAYSISNIICGRCIIGNTTQIGKTHDKKAVDAVGNDANIELAVVLCWC